MITNSTRLCGIKYRDSEEYLSRFELQLIGFSGYTRHTSSCMCVGNTYSPRSLTDVSFWRFTASAPACNSNYLGYLSISKNVSGR
ncbi:hypothetical protein BV921_07515 [Pectobacterium odoriferum]|nr:hypothetical protein BV925_12220 [Pectobacterium odoriferum]POE03023.1 hypothetical protein BVY05_03885 [Pectobacterium odoriferum]POE06433.1 hypothetical protein BV916_00730 [Pectobacterium odoriferum]POE10888.1 hypothetical protein BV921_07515 [Pectobacterium odoriferum]POE24515.1 hypothetical protein BV923_02805 [Pectobacterium odoriferum]